MNQIYSISFCGGGETCGSVAKRTDKNENQLFNTVSKCTQSYTRPFVSQQFSNAFDFGAFGLIKNMTK